MLTQRSDAREMLRNGIGSDLPSLVGSDLARRFSLKRAEKAATALGCSDPTDRRSLQERSGSGVPPSFYSSSHGPQTRAPVCLPIGADRQGRLVSQSRVKRLDSHEVRSMRAASSIRRNAGGGSLTDSGHSQDHWHCLITARWRTVRTTRPRMRATTATL
jgi:hypothetical protein